MDLALGRKKKQAKDDNTALTQALPSPTKRAPQWRVAAGFLASGAIAGCVVEAALYPLDTIKTRLQMMRSGGGVRALIKDGGGKTLYAGLKCALQCCVERDLYVSNSRSSGFFESCRSWLAGPCCVFEQHPYAKQASGVAVKGLWARARCACGCVHIMLGVVLTSTVYTLRTTAMIL